MLLYRQILLLFVLFFSALSFGQNKENNYKKLKEATVFNLASELDSVESFYISKNPITNKEYLTYLCWLADVYQDYPRIFLEAFPMLDNLEIDSLLKRKFTPIQIRSLVIDNFLANYYTFRPKYIDYPVLGITWKQAMRFLNWLSDRYNENTLIRKGYQAFYPSSQINENSFNTEAYLFDQYEGLIDKPFFDSSGNIRHGTWNDRLFIPSFRLPSYSELKMSNNFIEARIQPYNSNTFLKYWIKRYLSISKHTMTLEIGNENYFKFNNSIYTDPKQYSILELTLDYSNASKSISILDIFSGLNQEIINCQKINNSVLKDSLGHMPFLIIAEDSALNPIYISRINYSNENKFFLKQEKKYSIFRYSLCGIIKNYYVP